MNRSTYEYSNTGNREARYVTAKAIAFRELRLLAVSFCLPSDKQIEYADRLTEENGMALDASNKAPIEMEV